MTYADLTAAEYHECGESTQPLPSTNYCKEWPITGNFEWNYISHEVLNTATSTEQNANSQTTDYYVEELTIVYDMVLNEPVRMNCYTDFENVEFVMEPDYYLYQQIDFASDDPT
jgi:hypothetical protein